MKILQFAGLFSLLLLMSCSSMAKNGINKRVSNKNLSIELQETYWKLIELNGQPVTNPPGNQKEAHIILKKEDHRLQGAGTCNTLMGSYELEEGNQLRFSDVASTRMACGDMSVEDQLKMVLETTDNYVINGKYLMLHKARMSPLAKFEAK
jgi:heat shock protein HslJ